MTLDHYWLQLGRIVSNLQSLEFLLRAVLYKVNPPPPGHPSLSVQLDELKVGQTVPENPLTDYRSLDGLITGYNEIVERHAPSLYVDTAVVGLRDALAHGRVSKAELDSDMMILKFSPPKNDQVVVVYAEKMTESWFKEQLSRVTQEIIKVSKADQLLAPDKSTLPAEPSTGVKA